MSFHTLKFQPTVVKKFFSDEESKILVDFIDNMLQNNLDQNKNKYDGFEINGHLGCFMYLDSGDKKTFSKDIRNFIHKKIEKYLNVKIIDLSISWHRYSLLTGANPYVGSHVDQADKYHVMSISIPINNIFLWDFVVSGEKYKLNNNDAIFFCVSDDLHSRPFRVFKNDEHYDCLVIRFVVEDSKILKTESKHLNRDITEQRYRKLEIKERKENNY